MNHLKLSLLAFLTISFGCLANEEKFGIVTSQNGLLCASFGEEPPLTGSTITIVETVQPQYFFEGQLSAANENCSGLKKANVVGPYFVVTTVKKINNPFVGVAVLGKNRASLINNEIIIASTVSKEPIHFRSCASNEGLHFSSWQGQPLKGEQLWHLYFYLGYDVEPNCEEGDFKN